MQVKKNPKVDLNRNSGLYFVIGLTVVLFLTWRALEYKSYPSDTTTLDIAQAVTLYLAGDMVCGHFSSILRLSLQQMRSMIYESHRFME